MSTSYLAHHGIKGQKWGIRRFQNEDGSLTPAGKLHIGLSSKGNIALTREKTNKESVKKFVSKALISAGAIGAAFYISKHPDLVKKGYDYFHKERSTKDTVEDLFNEGPKIWSDKLGRYLSDEEADDLFSSKDHNK